MITSSQLATLKIRRVIFHDVPNSPKKNSSTQVTLSETETDIDAQRRGHLQTKLIRVLGSRSAYPIAFLEPTSSPVPPTVRTFTTKTHTSADFVAFSQKLAQYLFELQDGAISPGLLAVIDVVVDSKAALVIMKLEREAGAQLELTKKDGKQTFSMSVLDNLVLTDGTRLFKTAAFVRTSPDDDFASVACDSQRSVVTSDDVARFWLKFLGCKVLEEPRVSTHRFFEATLAYVNENLTDPVEKNDIYEHLQSEMKSNNTTFSPIKFIEDYLPEPHQKGFKEHLHERKIPLAQFQKDVSDIGSLLRRRAFETTKGILVSVPAEEDSAGIVQVRAEDILINDTLVRVGRKK